MKRASRSCGSSRRSTPARCSRPSDAASRILRRAKTWNASLAVLGADLLVATLDDLARGAVPRKARTIQPATYAHRLTKDDGIVSWARPARDIHNLIRGLHPWPHAFTFHSGHRLILHHAVPHESAVTEQPGTILAAHGDDLRVATGFGSLRIVALQAEGKRVMTAREFLAGHPMAAGELLTSAP